MSTTGGTQDWFYHAPAKRKVHEDAVEYPAVSQIPGLCSLAQNVDEENGAKVGWIKDTDTKYIRMAKMGGRKDLLRHRENARPKAEAKCYPRCEWFDYIEHSGTPDTGPRQSYLPDYMVYEEYNPDKQKDESQELRGKQRRPPFSLDDNLSAFQRDGDSVTDKTLKLPEIDRQYKKGVVFKVRKDKIAGVMRPANPNRQPRNKDRYPTGPKPPPKDQPVTFSKLLSMGYQEEWIKERNVMEHQKEPTKNKDSSLNKAKLTTEYREVICKEQQNEKNNTNMHSLPKVRHTKASEARKRRESGDDKELFKINRFSKVGPKVNTHWQTSNDSYDHQLATIHI